MADNIQPMAEYVVAQAEEPESKTASGILLTKSAQDKPKTVKVVAVGSDVEGVKTGDRILYKNTYEATDVKIGSEEYVIINKQNIIAVVK